jgi:FixJ family two-component response regulator
MIFRSTGSESIMGRQLMNLREFVAAGSCMASLHAPPEVIVIDHDLAVREQLEPLIRSAGWCPRLFASAEEFLAEPRSATPACLVLDMCLPGIGGLELQARLSDRPELPIIFVAGHIDVTIAVRAMKAGAVDILTKPFSYEALSRVVRDALERSRSRICRETELREARGRYTTLTSREQQVMALVVSGLLNKQVAFRLRISEITVKAHRGRVMRKMAADSLARLVNIASQLQMTPTLLI